MGRASTGDDNVPMLQFSIRCHPSVPVTTDELEEWLELQLEKLRADAPNATVRVSRVTQGLPSGNVDIGWLIEFEVPDEERLVTDHHLSEILTDMRLLGFQPTVLAPVALTAGMPA
jgi:hypothetical protein